MRTTKKSLVVFAAVSSLMLQGFGPLDDIKNKILDGGNTQQDSSQSVEKSKSNGVGKTTIACAGVGGVASLLGKNAKGKILAGVGGALLCAAVSKFWKDKLAKEDQEKLAVQTASTITTGKNSSFENNSTNVSGTVKVVKEEPNKIKKQKIKILKGRVKEAPPLVPDNSTYEVTSTANLRGGPSTDYQVVGKMNKGTATDVMGQVKESEWFLVAQDDVGLGYIHGSLLKPTMKTATASQALTGEIEKVKVETHTNCRTIQQEVNIPDQGVVTQDVKACQKSNGEWKIEKA